MEAIESGAATELFITRLKELEKEKNSLEPRLECLKPEPVQTVNLPEVGHLIKQFLENFDEMFTRAPIEERKELIKKLIAEIIVDREANVVRFYVRRIPPLTRTLEKLLIEENKPTQGKCVGFSSSGGRV